MSEWIIKTKEMELETAKLQRRTEEIRLDLIKEQIQLKECLDINAEAERQADYRNIVFIGRSIVTVVLSGLLMLFIYNIIKI